MTHPTHFTLWWSQWFITETRRFAYVLAAMLEGVLTLHTSLKTSCMHAWKVCKSLKTHIHSHTHIHAFGTTQAQFIAIAAQPSADRQPDPNRMNMQDWKIYAQNFTHYSCFPSFHGVYLCSCRMFYVCWMERNPPFVCEASGSRTRYIVQQQSSKEKRWAWNNTASKQSKAQHITSSESEYNALSERCAAW